VLVWVIGFGGLKLLIEWVVVMVEQANEHTRWLLQW
jgi:hypothetical protein